MSVIVFREILAAALIVSIVLACTPGVKHRGWRVGGMAAGLLGALVVALFAGAIGNSPEGVGPETFNAAMQLAAGLAASAAGHLEQAGWVPAQIYGLGYLHPCCRSKASPDSSYTP